MSRCFLYLFFFLLFIYLFVCHHHSCSENCWPFFQFFQSPRLSFSSQPDGNKKKKRGEGREGEETCVEKNLRE
ncbi:unnamed protein product [Meloidogyne enterolobii]|uniref:Uncharacterized protein n=1 Tax=Meloidogyne enterolobii TaxID=390850 RepID=A0ACB0Y8R0_MELEN